MKLNMDSGMSSGMNVGGRVIGSEKLRESAKGQPCAMQSPECNHDATTVCLRYVAGLGDGVSDGMTRSESVASSDSIGGNFIDAGRGSDDLFSFYGCQKCADWYALSDNPSWAKTEYAMLAMMKTQRIFYEAGLLILV